MQTTHQQHQKTPFCRGCKTHHLPPFCSKRKEQKRYAKKHDLVAESFTKYEAEQSAVIDAKNDRIVELEEIINYNEPQLCDKHVEINCMECHLIKEREKDEVTDDFNLSVNDDNNSWYVDYKTAARVDFNAIISTIISFLFTVITGPTAIGTYINMPGIVACIIVLYIVSYGIIIGIVPLLIALLTPQFVTRRIHYKKLPVERSCKLNPHNYDRRTDDDKRKKMKHLNAGYETWQMREEFIYYYDPALIASTNRWLNMAFNRLRFCYQARVGNINDGELLAEWALIENKTYPSFTISRELIFQLMSSCNTTISAELLKTKLDHHASVYKDINLAKDDVQLTRSQTALYVWHWIMRSRKLLPHQYFPKTSTEN